jgi:class 3 adenylate cyclase
MATNPDSPSEIPSADALEAGRDACRRNAWREALQLLGAADAAQGLEPGDLERLGEAAFWSSRLSVSVDAWERAYAAYVAAGNRRRAGFIALRLSQEYSNRLAPAVAAGWLKRAERLLEEQRDSAEYGYLLLLQARGAVGRGDLDGALERTRAALGIGVCTGDRDLQALSLHAQGHVLVTKGDVADGMALIDEATVAAVCGELGPLATALVYCRTISICRDLADFRRAGEWTAAAQRWCERQAITGFPGVCRVHRAEVMHFRGAWADAEQEVRRACRELVEFVPADAGEAFYELGEIRLTVGDLPAAEGAFRQAHELGREPEPGLSLLRLAEGKTEAAAASIRRALALESVDRLLRARLLPAQVEIALVAGDHESAARAAEELETIAETYGTAALEAFARHARGAVALGRGDSQAALQALRRAQQIWRELDAPYEAARTRILMADTYRALGDEAAGTLELQAAHAAFERLGAALDQRRVLERLAEVGAGVARAAAAGLQREARTFMFTDIEGSTSLVAAMGDEAWSNLLRWHDQTLRSLFVAHGGEEIKQAGDGFFVGFGDAASAIDCAVAIQRALEEHRRAHGFAPQVRIGVHAAEADRRGMDYGGKGVHEAARIAGIARGGEIVTSQGTLAERGGRPCRYPVSAPRPETLKGLAEPVPVVSIEWRDPAGAPARG